MQISLVGRAALITGGSMGLGKAMARRMALAGADVAIVARRTDVLESARAEIAAEVAEKGGGRVAPFACDVTKPDQIEATWNAACEAFGKIDILVNNAGSSIRGPFVSHSDAVWQADLDIKLFAQIRWSRLAFPEMQKRRWGRIINVLNIGAKAPTAEGSPTAVSRAAGMALSKVLAGEGAPYGILVNSLCTGQLVTDQIARRYSASAQNMTFDEYVADAGKGIPLGRMGDPDEFASLACFLASDQGGFITGTAINVDGGKSPVV
jgi:NAD(P)-dependent dehydrogenase (short-subunit alcohol dehydrogenase family)